MKRYRKTTLSITTFIVVVACVLAWHRFWPGPRRVNGGVFELQKVLTAQAGIVWRARFSPDGTRIVSASTDGFAKVWTTGATIVQNLKHPSGVTAAAFSPEGRTVGTTSYDGMLRIWNVEDGSLARTITAGSKTLWCLAFSPDGKMIASAGEDRVVSLWNVADGTLLRTLAGHRLTIWAVAFSPDGKTLVSGSFDRTAILWNVADVSQLRVLAGHRHGIVAVNFSPNGTQVVSGSDDGTAKLWNVADGNPIRTFAGGPYHVYVAEFSPDGKWLLIAGKDRPALGEFLQNVFGDSDANKWVTAQLLDLPGGEVLQTFEEHANDINGASFSPDGEWIVTASEDGTVDLWRRTNMRRSPR
jgi:WD40 repeat protein